MTDYVRMNRRGLARQMALRLVNLPALNPLAVKTARWALPPRLRQRIPVLNKVAVFDVGRGRSVLLRNVDRCQVAKTVYWSGGTLPSPADRLAFDVAMHFAGEADVFLDIGAYTGLFALGAAKVNPQLVAEAYEILPENYLFLWQNVFANDLVARVHPRLLGIGALDGELSAPVSFGAGVLPSAVALDSESQDGVTVPIVALDTLFSGFAGRMAWKIDVEGFEWQVFDGARSLIGRTRPSIVCEVLPNARDAPQIQAFFDALGYSIFQFTNGGLRHLPLTPNHEGRDWLFIPLSRGELEAAGFAVVD